MSDELVLCMRDGHVMHVELNRPERKNALMQPMYERLARLLTEANTDDDVRVVLITGKGDDFCAGNDLKDFAIMEASSPVFAFLESLRVLRKPLVVGIEGYAIGIGTTILCHADLAVAATHATFEMPFVRLGVVPEAGSSYLLPRWLGHVRASQLLLLGERFDGTQAAAWGLVHEVVDSGAAVEAAHNVAKRLAKQPPGALQATKALMREGVEEPLRDAMTREVNEFTKRLGMPESKEAITAFFEKRAPKF